MDRKDNNRLCNADESNRPVLDNTRSTVSVRYSTYGNDPVEDNNSNWNANISILFNHYIDYLLHFCYFLVWILLKKIWKLI